MRKAAVNRNGTILNKCHMLLAYADDIDIIGRGLRDVTAAFSIIEKHSAEVGLLIKPSYLTTPSFLKESTRLGRSVKVDNYNFEVVDDFVFLSSAINKNNNVSLKIKRRVLIANRCYYARSNHFNDKALSRRTKIKLYQTLILPFLLYSAESWVKTQADQSTLGAFERKLLRKIFGSIIVNGKYRRRMNYELYELYKDIDVVMRFQIDPMRWPGHVVRTDVYFPGSRISSPSINSMDGAEGATKTSL